MNEGIHNLRLQLVKANAKFISTLKNLQTSYNTKIAVFTRVINLTYA